MTTFSEIVDAADNLSVDEQESLVGILRRRIAERNRANLMRDVAEARAEHESGESRRAAAAEIMNDVRHES